MHGPRPSFFSFVLKGRIRTTTMTVSPPFSRFAAMGVETADEIENRRTKFDNRSAKPDVLPGGAAKTRFMANM
jgi:hypothetical protein